MAGGFAGSPRLRSRPARASRRSGAGSAACSRSGRSRTVMPGSRSRWRRSRCRPKPGSGWTTAPRTRTPAGHSSTGAGPLQLWGSLGQWVAGGLDRRGVVGRRRHRVASQDRAPAGRPRQRVRSALSLRRPRRRSGPGSACASGARARCARRCPAARTTAGRSSGSRPAPRRAGRPSPATSPAGSRCRCSATGRTGPIRLEARPGRLPLRLRRPRTAPGSCRSRSPAGRPTGWAGTWPCWWCHDGGADHDAFAVLVRRHQNPLYRYGRGLGLEHDTALDLVQEAFVKAFGRWDQCRETEQGSSPGSSGSSGTRCSTGRRTSAARKSHSLDVDDARGRPGLRRASRAARGHWGRARRAPADPARGVPAAPRASATRTKRSRRSRGSRSARRRCAWHAPARRCVRRSTPITAM